MPDPAGTPVNPADATESATKFSKRQKTARTKSLQPDNKTIKINTGTTSEIVIPQHMQNSAKFERSTNMVPAQNKLTKQLQQQQYPKPQQLPKQQQLTTPNKSFKQAASANQPAKHLDEKLTKKLGEKLSEGFDTETTPPFFDGTKFLSQDVDFQLFKGYNQLKSPPDYEEFVEIFFTTIWNSLDASEKQLLKGGLFNSGQGYLGEVFCTYRYVLKKPQNNETQIANLVTKLLQGIELEVDNEKIFIPALLAPNVDLYKVKIVRLSQMPPKFVSLEFGQFAFDEIIKSLAGFENCKLEAIFVKWQMQHKFQQERLPNLRNVFLLLTNVNKNNILSDAYLQSNYQNEMFVNITLMQFGFSRQLVADYYQWLQWPIEPTSDIVLMETNSSDSENNDSDQDDKSTSSNNKNPNLNPAPQNYQPTDTQDESNFQSAESSHNTGQEVQHQSWADIMSDNDAESDQQTNQRKNSKKMKVFKSRVKKRSQSKNIFQDDSCQNLLHLSNKFDILQSVQSSNNTTFE